MNPTATDHILDMPIAQFLGIEESPLENRLLKISFVSNHRNHLDTFHATAIYGLAEISTGVFLETTFPKERQTTIPVMRKSLVKYSAPCKGELHSEVSILRNNREAVLEKLYDNGKISLILQTDIYNEQNKLVFKGQFEWFVSVRPEYLKLSKTEASI